MVDEKLSLTELAAAIDAEVRGGPLPATVTAVSTDPRGLPVGCLYVALRHEQGVDCHRYVAQAADAGARAAVVDREGDRGLRDLRVPRLVVDDTRHAYGTLAALVRRAVAKPVVAVTGSNGKTTTKELLAGALSSRGPTHKTPYNYNGLVGVPQTLCTWPDDTWAAVLELGTSGPGSMARLTQIAAPTVGVITSIGAAHLQRFRNLATVAREKAELFAGLRAASTAVYNMDDPTLVAHCVPRLCSQSVLRFGTDPGADVRVTAVTHSPDGLAITLDVMGARHHVDLKAYGRHNAVNAAGAIAGAIALGLSTDEILAGLTRAKMPGGRLRVTRNLACGFHLIDDSYNANPTSTRAALATLAELAGGAATIAVLGGMLELGPDAPTHHANMGRAAAACGVGCVLAMGPHSECIVDGARAGGVEDAATFDGHDALIDDLRVRLKPDTWILVKGSNGMMMDSVVWALRDEHERYSKRA